MKMAQFTLGKNGRAVSINPALVSAVYEGSSGLTEIYTLDCARDKDCWDVKESFSDVVKRLEAAGGIT